MMDLLAVGLLYETKLDSIPRLYFPFRVCIIVEAELPAILDGLFLPND